MNKRKFLAVKENAEGDYYVQDSCCTLCGVPHAEAPGLFGGRDESGNYTHEQCFVKRQPETITEINQMMNAMATQEIGCIRYCGQNQIIKEMLKSMGEESLIDWNE